MWLMYVRAPTPDASQWPGRRFLALLDAVVWPGLVVAFVDSAPVDTGLLGSVTFAVCILVAVRRSACAMWRNERYRFTTWCIGLPLSVLLAMGGAQKLIA